MFNTYTEYDSNQMSVLIPKKDLVYQFTGGNHFIKDRPVLAINYSDNIGALVNFHPYADSNHSMLRFSKDVNHNFYYGNFFDEIEIDNPTHILMLEGGGTLDHKELYFGKNQTRKSSKDYETQPYDQDYFGNTYVPDEAILVHPDILKEVSSGQLITGKTKFISPAEAGCLNTVRQFKEQQFRSSLPERIKRNEELQQTRDEEARWVINRAFRKQERARLGLE